MSEALLDPAVANDWFAVGSAAGLRAGATQTRRVMGREVRLERAHDGTLHAAPGRAAEHCGCLWVCLGEQPRPLFSLPEFAAPGRRFLYMGAFGLQTGPLRVVENFLDMAHFPFVHSHILGAEPHTEVRPYQVEVDAGSGELWVRGCKFVQPMASAVSAGEADVDYVYRVVNPYTTLLYKADPANAGRPDMIFLFVQPVGEERCSAHFAISLYDDTSSDAEISAFQQTILGQDKPILENHVYKRLPLDPRLEVPARADAASSAFRRWLRDKRVRYGVLPQGAAPEPRAPDRLALTVARKWRVATDVMAFALRRADGAALPPATPGAHLDLHLAPGLTRQYSIVNGPGEHDEYRIAVKLEARSRGGSAAMHGRVQVGSRLWASRPKNNFELDGIASERVLIAGGIGVTPLLSMARRLAQQQARYALHYFCRSRDHAAFAAELEAEFGAALALWTGLDAEATGRRIDALLARPDAATHVYCCGPAPLMQRVRQAGTERGWPDGNLHFEHFQAAATADTHGAAFRVELARSGGSLEVGAGATIVQALRERGIDVPTNCEQGVCGTCLCNVLQGTPDHRDVYLSAAEKASGTLILPCVSRASGGSLTLDL